MELILQIRELEMIFQNPGLMFILGLLITILAYTGRRASRGPATETPLTVLLVIGVLMVLFGLLGLLA